MTQSFPFRDADAELAPPAMFPRPTMMPHWKQSDVNAAFALDALEKPGQKRRRSFGHQQDAFHVRNDENHIAPDERVSTDSAQLGNLEPYPGGAAFLSGLDDGAFPCERRGFYSRMLDTSSCGIFPFRASEGGEQPAASVLLTRSHDLFGARNPQRSLESAEVATAQAMANFQALIDQGRSSASGFHAYSGANATQTATLPVTHRQTPSLTSLRNQQLQLQQQLQQQQQQQQQQQLQYQQQQRQRQLEYQKQQHYQQQLEYQEQLQRQQQQQQQQQQLEYQKPPPPPLLPKHGFSLTSSFESLPTTSPGFNYFNGFHDSPLAFGASTGENGATGSYGAHGAYEATTEPAWPDLTCNTSVRNVSQSTLFQDPPSPCTPRSHTVLLSDAQEEYLQHVERLNAEAPLSVDSPPPAPRGRRLSYDAPPPIDERSSQENSNRNSAQVPDHNSHLHSDHNSHRESDYNSNFHSDYNSNLDGDYNSTRNSSYNIFHPFELDHLPEKHLHVYFDDSGVPQRVDVEDSAPQTVDECGAGSGTRGVEEALAAPQPEKGFSLRFAGGEKEVSRDNTDQFDLNEVPVISVGEVTPPKPRKKYHPRVAKDKRTYKRRVDGKKVPAPPVGASNTDSPAKKSVKKRPGQQPTQYDSTYEEGRDSSYPEVVDMDIEDLTTPGVVGTQHDTAVCDCEACIKARLERRSSTAPAHKSRFTFHSFEDSPQTPGSRHSPDSSSNSPSVRRTLFHARRGASGGKLPSAVEDPSSEQANAGVLARANSTTMRMSLTFEAPSSEQANPTAGRVPVGFDDPSSEQANPTAGRVPVGFDDPSSEQANSNAGRVQLGFDDPSSEQANPTAGRVSLGFEDPSSEPGSDVVLSEAHATAARLLLAFHDPSSEQANAAVLSLTNSTAGRLPLGFDDSSPEDSNAVVLSTARRSPLNFDDPSREESNAVVISRANSTLQFSFDDSSSPEEARAVVLSQANSTAFENMRLFLDSSPSTCLQHFNESASQLGFRWEGSHHEEEDDPQGASAFDWNPPLATPRALSSTTSSSFMSRLCPRNILSPQTMPFRNMNPIQRVVYLKSILHANSQITMTPESLLRHVHDHLPEEEKQEFQTSLWPAILKPLTEEQLKQLQAYADAETQQVVDGAPPQRRKPGPKSKRTQLAMSLFPALMPPAPSKKPGKGRKTKKNTAAGVDESPSQQPHPSLEIVPYEYPAAAADTAMVPYETLVTTNADTALVPYADKTSLVPFEAPVRKKKPRPKVVLDGETVRVWKLLMGKPGAAAAADETASDLENERKWAEERRKMKAQALLFIDRMHVVQGDRSFSCWKGSVVDSVVGAFLTQNVNDVLSSSAFMSMRSRFPGRGFRSSPLQSQSPEDDTMAQSFESSPPAAPQPRDSSPLTMAPQFPPPSVTLLESQGSRNEASNYAHLPTETVAWTQTHEDSAASTISEVINPPDDPTSSLPRSDFSAATISQVVAEKCAPEECLASSLAVKKLDVATISQAVKQAEGTSFVVPPLAGLSISEVFEHAEDTNSTLPRSVSTTTTTLSALSEVTDHAEATNSAPPSRPERSVSTLAEVIDHAEVRNSELPPVPDLSVSTLAEVTGHAEGVDSALPRPSLSTLSEVCPPPEDTTSVVPLSEPSKTCHSENSSALDYQTLPEELRAHHQVDVVVSSARGASGALVEGGRDASHGKYNPKTGLTGLERAKIEEKQVTARKSFDFTALHEEFRPREAGKDRPPAPPRTAMTEDGVDWEAVRAANVQEVADVIKERGLNWILAGRIKAFLERIHLDYGALDLEWLRSMSTDETKEFLLSIRGLGLKSVECIRLLTLHHLAFPVDTNVGRICVRLGWVPLEPLPEELQLHLLELYPVQATIQKYLWPRLCKLDQQTLYELHYQMITFGKVFCTKSKPNCNACPMRPECKHFASALSSAKLALPASERPNNGPTLALPPGTEPEVPLHRVPELPRPVSQYCQPIVEEPMTPESEVDLEEFDIEDYPFSVEEVEDDMDINICIQDPQTSTQLVQQSQSINNPYCSSILSITDTYVTLPESDPISKASLEPIPTIMEDWGGLATSGSNSVNVGVTCEESGCCPSSVIKIVENVCEEVLDLESNVNNTPSEVLIHPHTTLSHEMVLVPPRAASLPVPKLKNVGRLRTVHYVYELPDNHPLLDGLDPRELDDPCTYLLAIWSPGEVPESIPNMNDSIDEENPYATSNVDGEEGIKATILVPCRTAMRGSFPLNGTYFQVNEVFADHASSLQPMIVPRTLLWNLRRRFVFFGTSVTSIFRGMTVEEIQACFWRGYVCVRGFDRASRAPKPLVGRLHLQSGKASGKGAATES